MGYEEESEKRMKKINELRELTRKENLEYKPKFHFAKFDKTTFFVVVLPLSWLAMKVLIAICR